MGCLETMSKHVSIREYLDQPVPQGDLEKIVEAARRAPSAWGLQPYTIIAVTDKDEKKTIAEAVGGQEHVAKAPLLLVFAVDYAKLQALAEKLGRRVSEPKFGHLAIGLVDVGIAAAWAALAAEELGYGITFIALYSNPCRVAEILSLPENTLPAIALTIGKPAAKPGPQPRQPVKALLDKEKYTSPQAKAEAILEDKPILEKYVKLLGITLGPGKYYDTVDKELKECIEKKFKTQPRQ